MTYEEKHQAIIERELTKFLGSDKDFKAESFEELKKVDYYNLMINTFNWFELPEEIDPHKRRIELNNCFRGKTVFFKDPKLGYFILPFVYTGGIDAYGDFHKVRPIGLGGVTFDEYTIDENCVIIRDNYLEIPSALYARYYAHQVATIVNAREKNLNFLKLPFVFSGSGDIGEDKKTAFEIKQILCANDNEIAFVTDAFKNLTLFDLKPQYFGRELTELIKNIDNEFYEYLGVRHLQDNKKERMITEEVEVTQEKYSIHSEKREAPRIASVERINSIFGLNIRCELNEHIFNEVTTTNVVASVSGGINQDKG